MVSKPLCKQQYALDHHADTIITLSYYDAVQHQNGGRRVLKSQRAGKHMIEWTETGLHSEAPPLQLCLPPSSRGQGLKEFPVGPETVIPQLAEGNLLAGVSLNLQFLS